AAWSATAPLLSTRALSMPADSLQTPIPPEAGRVLLPLARGAIAAELRLDARRNGEEPQWLLRQGASFITLMLAGKLRGCMRTLRAHGPLAEDVRHNAVGAAFRDPRFTPLTTGEFTGVAVEISVLSPLEPMQFGDEADALKQLRPGMDGIVFEYGRHT